MLENLWFSDIFRGKRKNIEKEYDREHWTKIVNVFIFSTRGVDAV